MINVRTLGVVIILSAAAATSAFAKESGHSHDRYRKAYNQVSVPYEAPAISFSGRESSSTSGAWLHPADLNPPGN
jgi:hypothetical protein